MDIRRVRVVCLWLMVPLVSEKAKLDRFSGLGKEAPMVTSVMRERCQQAT